MDAEEQIRRLKQIPPMTKEEKRKKIMTSIVLSISALVSVLFLVFAFVQKQEADRQRKIAVAAKMEAEMQRALAEEQRKMALAAQVEAEHQRAEAEKQRIAAIYSQQQAVAARDEADKQRVLALEALENCKKSKK